MGADIQSNDNALLIGKVPMIFLMGSRRAAIFDDADLAGRLFRLDALLRQDNAIGSVFFDTIAGEASTGRAPNTGYGAKHVRQLCQTPARVFGSVPGSYVIRFNRRATDRIPSSRCCNTRTPGAPDRRDR
jgi:hypothetical protein